MKDIGSLCSDWALGTTLMLAINCIYDMNYIQNATLLHTKREMQFACV